MNKINTHECRYCGWAWMSRRVSIKSCPSCQREGFEDPDIKISPYYQKLYSYKRILKKLEPGETITLPWISTYDYPDIKMLRLVTAPGARKKYDSLVSPAGLKITRKDLTD